MQKDATFCGLLQSPLSFHENETSEVLRYFLAQSSAAPLQQKTDQVKVKDELLIILGLKFNYYNFVLL